MTVRARIGTEAFANEERRISKAWAEATAETKAYYEGAATERDNFLASLVDREHTADELSRNSGGRLSAYAAIELRKTLVRKCRGEIKNHEAFASGLGLMNGFSALKPEKIVTSRTCHDVKMRLLQAFEQDSTIHKNPGHKMLPKMACSESLYGRCKEDAFIERANVATFNAYKMLRLWKRGREDFPLAVQFTAANVSKKAYLIDTIGEGATILLLMLTPANEECDTVAKTDDGKPMSKYAQEFIADLMQEACEAQPDEQVETIDMSISSVTGVRCGKAWASKRDGLVLHVGTVRADSKMTLRTKKPEAAKEPPISLPFGIKMVSKMENFSFPADDRDEDLVQATPKKKKDAPHEDSDSDGKDASDDDAKESDFEETTAIDKPPPEEPPPAEREEDDVGRLGLTGFGFALASRSKCVVCSECGVSNEGATIREGSLRCSVKLVRSKPDRFVHMDCVKSGGVLSLRGFREQHLRDSIRWLSHAVTVPDVPESTRVTLLDACDKLSESASGPGAASASGAAGSSTVVQ